VKRWHLINFWLRRKCNKPTRYLEIGVRSGTCWKRVLADEKVGVDPDPRARNATHRMTSDQFFATYRGGGFDVAFIDGLHEEEQALRDLRNVWGVLRPHGMVVLHDCNPLTELAQGGIPIKRACKWNGTVWRAWVRALGMPEWAHGMCVEMDEGLGVITKRINWRMRRGMRIHPYVSYPLTWEDLNNHRVEMLRLLSFKEWRRGVL
jgi:hypothetical protein